MNVKFSIVIPAQSVAEALAMYAELQAAGVTVETPEPRITRAPSPLASLAGDNLERKLRDEWKTATGRNFSFKKTLRALYPSPLAALQGWKNGEFSREDMSAGESDNGANVLPDIDTEECV